MSGPCPYLCLNKTEYGYCRSTACTNKSVIECLTNKEENASEYILEENNPCKGCKHIAFRYPYASMYPCNNCIRADMKDYYEPQEESNG